MSDNEFIKKVVLERIADSSEPYEATRDYCSPSTLKRVKKSPLHYKEEERKESAALAFGKAYHCAVLEPNEFEHRYYVSDTKSLVQQVLDEAAEDGKTLKSPTSTKRFKELKAQEDEMHPGEEISQEDYDKIMAMRARLMAHPYARYLLTGGEVEKMHYCKLTTMQDEEIGVRFIPDNLKKDKFTCVDLKTATDASVDGFTRTAANLDYQLQAALSVDLLEAIYSPGVPWRFVYVVQETKAPYAFNIFNAAPNYIGQGRYEYELLMMLWQHAVKNDECPGYQVWADNEYGIHELELPRYAIKPLDWFIHKRPNYRGTNDRTK